MGERVVHRWTLRASVVLFTLFLVAAVVLWVRMPEQYPIGFDPMGNPTRSAEGPGIWVLLVAVCAISFGQGYLFQRFVVTDPNSTLLNWPYKDLFHRLPVERKVPVLLRGNRLLGLINMGMVLTFLATLFLMYLTAQDPASAARTVARWMLWPVIGGTVVLPMVEILLLRRMIRRKLQEEGIFPAARGPA